MAKAKASAVVLFHDEGGDGWEERRLALNPDGGIGLATIHELLGCKSVQDVQLGPSMRLLMDEEAMLTGRDPSVAIRLPRGTQAFIGPVVIVSGADGGWSGLAPTQVFEVHTRYSLAPVDEART